MEKRSLEDAVGTTRKNGVLGHEREDGGSRKNSVRKKISNIIIDD